MNKTTILVCLCCLGVTVSALARPQFAGTWEYQALNAGDTSFKVEQKGDSLTFYRVLYPEFEGKRFKLEHLYKGKLVGDKLTGKMNVREEGMNEFEFLRVFSGKVLAEDKMVMDEMNLSRKSQPLAEDKAVEDQEDQRPAYSRVVIQQKTKQSKAEAEKPPAATVPDKPAEEPKASRAAPLNIPKLIPVALRIETPNNRKARTLLAEGDSLYERKLYTRAVKKYAAAIASDKNKVELYYKLGLGHGVLGSLAVRKGDKASARKHYKQAIANWSRASRLDPYNWGAKENIRRAKDKLQDL